MANSIINSRRTYQLAYNNTLCAIDDKRAGSRHKRQISHKDVMLADLFCLIIMKSYLDLKGCSVSCISLLALFDGIFHIVSAQFKADKFQAQIAIVIRDGRNIPEHFI